MTKEELAAYAEDYERWRLRWKQDRDDILAVYSAIIKGPPTDAQP